MRATRWRVLMLGGAVLLGACSSSGASDQTKSSTTTTTEQATDSDAFCTEFRALAEQREQQGGGGVQPGSMEAVPDGKEGWDRRIATTSELAAAAPADYQDEGETYVELVTARAALFAAYDYPASLADIPADATQAFIRDHGDEQQVANRFIAFAKEECGVE
jgi:hypothetical protein